MARTWQLVVYVRDTRAQVRFWTEALGYVEEDPPEGFETWHDALRHFEVPEERWDEFAALVDPEGSGPRIFLHRVPEDKPDQRNRLHLDLRVTERGADDEARRAAQETERDRLVGLGATEVGRAEDMGDSWIVMRDPEGNEFCLT